jgi:hypothetical protein
MTEAKTPGPVKAGWSTPLLRVSSIERSMPFYERLGFEVVDTDRCEPLGWARLHCEGGALMFVRDPGDGPPIAPEAQTVLFYLYTPDLAGLREQLSAAGVEVSEIRRPFYMPSGEVSLRDPDGYMLLVGHWGDEEHAAWLERIGRNPAG